MFPNADHSPAMSSEYRSFLSVPLSIVIYFLLPPVTINFGKFKMFGAAVPKTTIYKNADLRPAKNYVSFAF
jgi:hypothetical protein